MIKDYAAFIQNTISPLLERVHDLVTLANSKGLPITEASIRAASRAIFLMHLTDLVIRALCNLLITLIIALTCLAILK